MMWEKIKREDEEGEKKDCVGHAENT